MCASLPRKPSPRRPLARSHPYWRSAHAGRERSRRQNHCRSQRRRPIWIYAGYFRILRRARTAIDSLLSDIQTNAWSERPTCEVTHVYGRQEAHHVILESKADYDERFADLSSLLDEVLPDIRESLSAFAKHGLEAEFEDETAGLLCCCRNVRKAATRSSHCVAGKPSRPAA